MNLQHQFGPIDIYVFDQLLRGNIRPGMRILDAGCGGGRNLVYFLREGYDVSAVDADAYAVESVRNLATQLAPKPLPNDNFRNEPIEAMSFPAGVADVVLSNAVLHFAGDDQQFNGMLRGMWRVLKPGGVLFCRLASSIGIEQRIIPIIDQRIVPIKGRRHLLPDGSERYLVDEKVLLQLTAELGGSLVDPLKTTVVQDQRSMTTWVVRKNM